MTPVRIHSPITGCAGSELEHYPTDSLDHPACLSIISKTNLQITRRDRHAGAGAGSAAAGAAAGPAILKTVQQASDSDQTQDSDSQPEAQQDSHEEAAVPTSPLPAVQGPAKQGGTGRALPRGEGMYTGAFAFPDSASLEVSQSAVDLPLKSGRGHRRATAAVERGATHGKTAETAETAAAVEAGKEAAPAVKHALGGSTSSGAGAATSGGSPKARVMPSGWKRKKADPVAVEAVGTSRETAADAAAAPAGPSPGVAACVVVSVCCLLSAQYFTVPSSSCVKPMRRMQGLSFPCIAQPLTSLCRPRIVEPGLTCPCTVLLLGVVTSYRNTSSSSVFIADIPTFA